jgi:5'-deoxynucleotidase YfbR-like HD superfamily hydrolase
MLEILSNSEIMSEYVLSKIIRYNHRRKLQDESVAEHSFFVSLFCLKIMAKLKLPIDIEREVLILSALHDAGESKTSDIPHDVKANYPQMRDILDKVEEDYYHKNWKSYFDCVQAPKTVVKYIIKLADAYSVYQYCLNEMELGNVSDDIHEIKAEACLRIYNYTDLVNKEIEKIEKEGTYHAEEQ